MCVPESKKVSLTSIAFSVPEIFEHNANPNPNRNPNPNPSRNPNTKNKEKIK